jgi:hypothetical protein
VEWLVKLACKSHFAQRDLDFDTPQARKLMSHGSGLTKRVWVQTSSGDHPHALPNYERRGFRVFRVEREAQGGLDSGDRPVADGDGTTAPRPRQGA